MTEVADHAMALVLGLRGVSRYGAAVRVARPPLGGVVKDPSTPPLGRETFAVSSGSAIGTAVALRARRRLSCSSAPSSRTVPGARHRRRRRHSLFMPADPETRLMLGRDQLGLLLNAPRARPIIDLDAPPGAVAWLATAPPTCPAGALPRILPAYLALQGRLGRACLVSPPSSTHHGRVKWAGTESRAALLTAESQRPRLVPRSGSLRRFSRPWSNALEKVIVFRRRAGLLPILSTTLAPASPAVRVRSRRPAAGAACIACSMLVAAPATPGAAPGSSRVRLTLDATTHR